MRDYSYEGVMSRMSEIIKNAVSVDYNTFERKGYFDYEALMGSVPYSLEEVEKILHGMHVGNTPIVYMDNLTKLARKVSPKGMGARIFVKDEAQNPSGSFKARRAALSCYEAKRLGYKGTVAATSGNYGAAVACMSAKLGLDCIVVQECFDSRGFGQPEILEKQRKCEALGAEVIQLTVGPELFYETLKLLEETGFYDASLYSATAIAGVETLGAEIVRQFQEMEGKEPDVVIATNAGGGNLTGTARGMRKAGAKHTKIYAASVDLSGLHMASDHDFNRKSFTTGHTGFGIPFAVQPDRSDVKRSAARPLRYMDAYMLMKQGEVFYITEALAALEGMERGPAGNVSLAAAFALAQTLPEDQTIVVQETEYTGAGKHPMPQLTFAKENGVEVLFGDPEEEIPGKNIILPDHPSRIKARYYDLAKLRKSALKRYVESMEKIAAEEVAYLKSELNCDEAFLNEALAELGRRIEA
ncbi:MAG: 2-amino-4-oxopentanoate thiolase subunit OrtB [Clostridiales bacterium]|nr:2-amino-4-oxopentanoate thiolase subunit OrtB [Clostridiales bacterium]MDD7432678.1 2-amino-4-oxopentanoate thiolase subunit OrtB [Clostridiales bacterium]MDY3060910.1 2-amino-4-oxopentanoate thiolase subunit OrtB [Eubacteriales bacterium]